MPPSLLLRWVVVACLTDAALCLKPFPVCNIPCCTVVPSCAAALRVACNCSGENLSLRKGDIPQTVSSLKIWNARNVTIDRAAINDLTRLTNFSLRFIDLLKIEEGGMVSDKPSKIRSVRFEDITTIHIGSMAFSGIWESRTRIWINAVSRLIVAPEAFAQTSTTLGPSLDIRRVGMLHLAAEGFLGPLYSLTLDDVSMKTCHGKSFRGKIDSLTLNKVSIDEARAHCFSDLSTVTVSSGKFGTVRRHAFSGAIRELSIKDSSFSTVQEEGFHIQTDDMEIVHSQIQGIAGNGLSVNAKNSIKLENIRVDFLEKNGLAGLVLQQSPGGDNPLLKLLKLDVLKLVNGSLAIADCVDVQVYDLRLEAPFPRICPTEKWVRRLVGASPSGDLNPAQYNIFMEIFGFRLCSDDSRASLPNRKVDPKCEQQTAGANERFASYEYDPKWYEDGEDSDEVGKDTVESVKRSEDDNGDVPTLHDDESAEEEREESLPPRGDRGHADGGSASDSMHSQKAEEALVAPDKTGSRDDDSGESGELGEHEQKTHHSDSTAEEVSVSAKPALDQTVSVEPPGVAAGRLEDASRVVSGRSGSPSEPGVEREPSAAESEGVVPSSADTSGHVVLLEQQQLTLFVALGAVLSLAVVLLCSLLVLLMRRRGARRSRSSTEKKVLGLVTEQLSRPRGEYSQRPRADSVVSAATSAAGSHLYESMLYAPPPPQLPAPLQPHYQACSVQSAQYERLLDR